MEPVRNCPVRSTSRASRAKTEGVYPLAVGGSPAARPISRAAMAKRVSESRTRRTCLPWAAKYSAIALHKAKQLGLQRQWHLSDLIQKQRAPVSGFNASNAA